MTTPFDTWWVGYNGAPPRNAAEQGAHDVSHRAWKAAASDVVERHNNLILRNGVLEKQLASAEEEVNVLRIQRREALRERDEAVRLQQRHEELRRQAERQCDRIRKFAEKEVEHWKNLHPHAETKYSITGGVVQRQTFIDTRDEVMRARKKHPGNRHLLAALTEEVGELAEALLDNQGKDRVYAEAMQCACVAIRIMEEGDGDFDD